MKLGLTFLTSIVILISNLSVFSQNNLPSGWFFLSNLPGDSLLSVYFNDNFTGWTAGKDGRILITTNGGMNWNAQITGTTNILEELVFTSTNIGYCVGAQGTILKTINGGVDWIHQNSGTKNYLKSVSFVNDSLGFAVGLNRTALSTTNGGEIWNNLFFLDSLNFYSVRFINAFTGWLSANKLSSGTIADTSIIYKTFDAGNTWFAQLSQQARFSPFLSIQFADSLNVWTTYYGDVIDASYIYKSNNGGTTWTEYSLGNFGPYSIFFSNKRKGWGVGYLNRIYYTVDGGETWTNSPAFTVSINYNSVFFADTLTGWAVSGRGLIVKTTTGGVLTGFSNTSSEIPDKFFLSQNYPNPFNPRSHLEFGIADLGFVSLKVYDMLGNEVATLVNENKPAGSYEVEFDGSEYASGVYFYRLEIDGIIIDSKRMLLLK